MLEQAKQLDESDVPVYDEHALRVAFRSAFQRVTEATTNPEAFGIRNLRACFVPANPATFDQPSFVHALSVAWFVVIEAASG